ncbi:MAG: conjugal transfer protein TraF [Elusimicrobia bacterium]|nr:conjugal transfer protein TraF [Elusimicrobiota bacterium]
MAKALAVLLSVMSFMAMRSYALFNDSACGARATAMGGAFTAVPGGAEAVCSNPASLVETQSPELTAAYGRLYSGLTDESKIGQGYFGFAGPVKRYLQGSAGFAWNDTRLSEAYSETTFAVSYATSVYRGLGTGVTLKYLRRGYVSDSYTAVDPVFSGGYTKSGFGADLGFFYRPRPAYALGLAVKNINKPDMGLASPDKLPVEIRAGASYALRTSLLGLDASFAGSDYTVSAGAEYSFQRRYALRMGLSAGNDSRRNLNLGVGGRFGLAQFDYSFSLPLGGISGTMGSHRLAFSFRFGAEADLDAIEMRKVQEKASLQEEQIKALQQKLDESGHGSAAPAAQPDIAKQLENLKTELEKSRSEMETLKAKPAAKPAQPKAPQPGARRTYVVKDGDTLESIAASVYGDPERWPEIYRANTGAVGRGGEVKAGQVLVLP